MDRFLILFRSNGGVFATLEEANNDTQALANLVNSDMRDAGERWEPLSIVRIPRDANVGHNQRVFPITAPDDPRYRIDRNSRA